MSDNKHQKHLQLLKDYNAWRRANYDLPQPHPKEIGEAIDYAISVLEGANSKSTVEILRQYAEENKTTVRSTSDLSPLEEWLLLKLKTQKK